MNCLCTTAYCRLHCDVQERRSLLSERLSTPLWLVLSSEELLRAAEWAWDARILHWEQDARFPTQSEQNDQIRPWVIYEWIGWTYVILGYEYEWLYMTIVLV
jgi:hypothetical protein